MGQGVRTQFFNQIKHLVVKEKADPNVSFITRVESDGTRKTSRLLPELLHYNRDYPDEENLMLAHILLEHNANPDLPGKYGFPLELTSVEGLSLLLKFNVKKPENAVAQCIPSDFNMAKVLCLGGFSVDCFYSDKVPDPISCLRLVLCNKQYDDKKVERVKKLEMINLLIDCGASLYENKGTSFSRIEEKLASKDVSKLTRRFHIKIHQSFQEVDKMLPPDLANIVVDYLSREGCAQAVREKQEKAVQLDRLIKAKKIELDRQRQEESNKRLANTLLSQSLDTLCKKREQLDIRSRLEETVNQVRQQQILDPRLFRSRHLYTRSLKTRIKNDKLELRNGEVVATSTI